MKTILLAIAVLVFGLSACGTPIPPTLEPTILPIAVFTLTSTPLPVIPTATFISPSTLPVSPTPLLFTDPSIPLSERIVYYYFVTPAENPIPGGSVTISSTYILAPTFSDIMYSPDTVDNLRTALEIALYDGRNGWISSKVKIVDITFDGVHASVVLQGEYFGVGDVTLIAARMQILLTLFANAHVQTANVTINGDTIGNMGVSTSMNAKPANYVFTRAEIEAIMIEHAYVTPSTSESDLPLQPDLIINFMYLEMEGRQGNCVNAYSPYGIRVQIKNNGSDDAEPFFVDLNGVLQEVSNGLLVGESIELHFAGTISSGQYEATADIANQVVESREDNNTYSFHAPTPTPPPLCVDTATATP